MRFNIDENYLRRQVAAMGPYRFDYVVVDAGWYEACGRWVPDTKKFTPGNFETLLAEVRQKGVHPGIWTCPQFVKANANDLPADVDRPGYYERFIDGHLLDLAGCDFRARLLAHVAMLRERYHADWWKYDQILFTARTRQGIMRNVIAFQDALTAVRKAQPDLVIENCQSGGRMINEFTVQATQGQWLRDGSGTGLKHARSNFTETLGALEFLPPWIAVRWMNRPYDNAPENDALTRAYCRSCMAGTWGLVADLPQVPDRQRKVILDEVDHYRRLSKYKTSCLYDLHHAEPKKPYEAVVFYTADGRAAAVIMLRMQDGPFETVLRLGGLAGGQTYHVEDVDRSEQTQYSADNLPPNGAPRQIPGRAPVGTVVHRAGPQATQETVILKAKSVNRHCMQTKLTVFQIFVGLSICLTGQLLVAPLRAGFAAGEVHRPARIALWPGQAPVGHGRYAAGNAFITIYRPARANGAAIIICPGGGYGSLVTGPEGTGIAEWLNRHGITGIVLEYRLPNGNPFAPLLDAQRAIRTVRSRAQSLCCDSKRIGMIGFSAGGHLASTAATHFDGGDPKAADPIDRIGCRPDFAVLIYPLISMGQIAHSGSRTNLLGPSPSGEMVALFSNEKQVNGQTPPAFLAHAKDDTGVSPENSRMFYEARADLQSGGPIPRASLRRSRLEWLSRSDVGRVAGRMLEVVGGPENNPRIGCRGLGPNGKQFVSRL